jgi:hypothetical protein
LEEAAVRAWGESRGLMLHNYLFPETGLPFEGLACTSCG